MILVEGASGSGGLAQIVPDVESAERFMARLDAVSRHPITWQTFEVEATELRAAVAEVAVRKKSQDGLDTGT